MARPPSRGHWREQESVATLAGGWARESSGKWTTSVWAIRLWRWPMVACSRKATWTAIEHVICLSAENGKRLWAVQPGRLGAILDETVEKKLKQFDKDQSGELELGEAVAAIGWDFSKHDRGVDPENAAAVKAAAQARAADVLEVV